ncbi:MAG: hypothetical protein ACI8X5_002322 [Planctomycetota bacterium]|jgi:hypothetical protein
MKLTAGIVALSLFAVSGSIYLIRPTTREARDLTGLRPTSSISTLGARQEDNSLEVAFWPAPVPERAPAQPGAQILKSRVGLSAQETPSPELPGRSIEGQVLDPSGKPLAGARVTPWRMTYLTRCLNASSSKISHDDGRFEITVDSRGPASFTVEHPDYLTWNGDLGTSLPATIQLRAPSTLRGRVLDNRGQAASLSIVHYNTQGLRPVRRQLEVSPNGEFEIGNLEPGDISLWVSGPHGSLEAHNVTVGTDEPLILRLAATRRVLIRVEDAEHHPLDNVRVVLMPRGEPRALESRQTNKEGEAEFSSATTAPLAVTAEHAVHRFETHPVDTLDGQLTLRALPSGTLIITSSANASLILDLQEISAAPASQMRLVIEAGADLQLGALAPGLWEASWSLIPNNGRRKAPEGGSKQGHDHGAQFEIKVNEEQRLSVGALPAATIRGRLAWPIGNACAAELREINSAELLARVALDSRGAFTFEGLRESTYLLTICAEGGGRWQSAQALALRSGEQFQVSLAPTGSTYQLTVRDTLGLPISSACASLRDERLAFDNGSTSSSTSTTISSVYIPAACADEFGGIELNLLSSGKTVVIVEAPGFEPIELELPRDSNHVDAQLSRR